MGVKLLFNEGHEKKINRHAPSSDNMSRETYEDILDIRQRVCEAIPLGDDHELVRIRFIREFPQAMFRVTILKRYKESHLVKKKGGGTTMLPPGIYVQNQYLAEKVSPCEYVFTPPLPDATDV